MLIIYYILSLRNCQQRKYVIVTIKQQDLLSLTTRKLSLHLIYILFTLNFLQNALLSLLLYLIYASNITRLLYVIYTIILI